MTTTRTYNTNDKYDYEEDYFSFFHNVDDGFDDDENDDKKDGNSNQTMTDDNVTQKCTPFGDNVDEGDLHAVMGRIGSVLPNYQNDYENQDTEIEFLQLVKKDLQHRQNLITRHMGSMAQCRGLNGDVLREAGALEALLSLLYHVITGNLLPPLENVITSNEDDASEVVSLASVLGGVSLFSLAMEVTICALGALRDLACGSASNRIMIGNYSSATHYSYSDKYPLMLSTDNTELRNEMGMTGIQIITWFVKRYHGVTFQNILSLSNFPVKKKDEAEDSDFLRDSNVFASVSTDMNGQLGTEIITPRGKKELRLLTNAVGVIRNASHSTRVNCEKLHDQDETCNISGSNLLVWRLKYGAINKTSDKPEVSIIDKDKSLKIKWSERKVGYDYKHELPPRLSTKIPVSRHLPDSTLPYREACYRIAGSIINIAEKSEDFAIQCSRDDDLIYLLIESWGGSGIIRSVADNNENGNGCYNKSKAAMTTARTPLLHLGLAAILRERMAMKSPSLSSPLTLNDNDAASKVYNEIEYDEIKRAILTEIIEAILHREKERKCYAQEREKQKTKKNNSH